MQVLTLGSVRRQHLGIVDRENATCAVAFDPSHLISPLRRFLRLTNWSLFNLHLMEGASLRIICSLQTSTHHVSHQWYSISVLVAKIASRFSSPLYKLLCDIKKIFVTIYLFIFYKGAPARNIKYRRFAWISFLVIKFNFYCLLKASFNREWIFSQQLIIITFQVKSTWKLYMEIYN